MSKKKNSFQQKLFSELEIHFGQQKILAIHEQILKLCGCLETAVFLSQLLYWSDKGKSTDGFIFKSAKEWHSETLLSEYHIKKAAKKLQAVGFLSIKKKMANGHPTMHYKLDLQGLRNTIFRSLTIETEQVKNGNRKNSESITDITTNNTSEKKDNKGMNSNELHSIPLSFRDYKKNCSLTEDAIEAIEYFLRQYEQFRGEKHPNLKPEQWERVVETIFSCYDDSLDGKWFDQSLDYLKLMIDQYFATKFQEGCNYSILHFNNSRVKLHRMYETVY